MIDPHEEFMEREIVRITSAIERLANAFDLIADGIQRSAIASAKMASAFVALQERNEK